MKRFARPQLERLERRDCPAITLTSTSSGLTIRGVPNGDLLIQGDGNNGTVFNVFDNGTLRGVYNLSGFLNVQLTNRPGNLDIDLNGGTIGGNVLVDLGQGYTGPTPTDVSVDIFDQDATAGLPVGSIGGQLTILNGNAQENVNVGADFDPGTLTTDLLPITLYGPLNATGKAHSTRVDSFQLGEGSVVRNTVSVTNFDDVTLGLQDTVNAFVAPTLIQGNVSINSPWPQPGLFVDLFGTFNKNVSVNAGNTPTSFNRFTMSPPELDENSVIGGNLTVSFGYSLGNDFTLNPDFGGTGETQVMGSVSFTSQNPGTGFEFDSAVIYGYIGKNLTINLGGGDGSVHLGNFLGIFSAPTLIGGDVSITMGDGDHLLEFDAAATVMGSFRYRGGLGTDAVIFDGTVLGWYILVDLGTDGV